MWHDAETTAWCSVRSATIAYFSSAASSTERTRTGHHEGSRAEQADRFDAVTDVDAATRIYRRCRQSGITPRGMVDCMIAAVAHRNALTLLAWDADMIRVSEVIGIDVDEGSLRVG